MCGHDTDVGVMGGGIPRSGVERVCIGCGKGLSVVESSGRGPAERDRHLPLDVSGDLSGAPT